jgi:nucleotide-binding universal stress UspA family protein
MGFKRILCAVDFSRDSVEAFRVAVETARYNSAALHVFDVIEAEPGVPKAAVAIVEKANAALAALIESTKPSPKGLALTSEVATGLPSDEIVAQAKNWQADLAVLGAKGAGLLEKIVGGTAERAMKEAPCSVLVVRAQ